MNFPKYVEVDGIKYKINTDFRVAIECNKIAEDETIGDFERALGIICVLYGKEALNNPNHYEKLLELAQKYFACGKEIKNEQNKKPDMDFEEDAGYIASSFQYDYKYNPYEMEYCHWYKFYNDLSNLSNSELGNCCVLSNVRNLRNFDVSKIKDSEQKRKIIEAKKQVALKKNIVKKKPTKEQMESAKKFFDALNIRKE